MLEDYYLKAHADGSLPISSTEKLRLIGGICPCTSLVPLLPMLPLKAQFIRERLGLKMATIYVGVQHPMVLILRKADFKLISCSRKKIIVYEAIYTLPLVSILHLAPQIHSTGT
jgi:hypothetical protein